MEKIFVDVGSSTVKVYFYHNKKLTLESATSIPFKDNFDPQTGISKESKQELFALLHSVKKSHPDIPIELYATAVFRKMEEQIQERFQKEFFKETGITFSIISQEEENEYLQLALVGNYKGSDPVLLINIGGGSTELVVMQNKQPIESHNIDMGVGTVLTQFPTINQTPGVSLQEVVTFVSTHLPALPVGRQVFTTQPKLAFYSGGELTYMERASYPLQPNTLFKDPNHPSLIKAPDFQKKNEELFSTITLEDLEKLMPENPRWMHGARACSAMAQAVAEKYTLEILIPSNANLIDGVVNEMSS